MSNIARTNPRSSIQEKKAKSEVAIGESPLVSPSDLIHGEHASNISQTEVANRMGVRQPTVCGFEQASSDSKLSTLQRYARAIDARIRIVVEPTYAAGWPSRSTQTYARGAYTSAQCGPAETAD
jgi:DNA-binding XRE family transcriptional regulator